MVLTYGRAFIAFFCGQKCVTQTFVQESNFFGNTNILLSKPTKKSNAAYHFSFKKAKGAYCFSFQLKKHDNNELSR